MKLSEPVIVARKINAAKRRAAGKRIAANISRLQRIRSVRTADQALAEARGERLARWWRSSWCWTPAFRSPGFLRRPLNARPEELPVVEFGLSP